MAQFKPGVSGNPTGRPKGAKNKNSELIRADLQRFIAKNIKSIQADYDQIKNAEKRLYFMERLIKHILPPPAPELERLTEEDLDNIIRRLKENHLRAI